jgi:hypothetical protein
MSGLCWFEVLCREGLGPGDRDGTAMGPAAVRLLATCCVVGVLGLPRRFPARRGGVDGGFAFGLGTAPATTTCSRGVYGGTFLFCFSNFRITRWTGLIAGAEAQRRALACPASGAA